MMLAILTDDSLVMVFRGGDVCKDSIMAFSQTFLKAHDAMTSSSPLLAKVWRHEAAKPLASALERIAAACRVFCHFFCEPPVCGPPTDDEECHEFLKEAASSGVDKVFERMLRRVLTEPDLFWNREYREIVKKGGSGVLVREKVNELSDLLNGETPTRTGLATTIDLYNAVHEATRSQKMAPLTAKLYAFWPR